ncbi:MAG: hypothetical protein H6Q39_1014 [Chloroflexi bacterium]|jgi:hypothetical protein|nr:hypothetical protein [Chloroflexota bacterium]
MSNRLIFWVAGAVLIIIGLVMVRVLSGMYSDRPVTQLVVYIVGVILALGGLGVILAGIRRR